MTDEVGEALQAWLLADRAEWLALEPFLDDPGVDLDGKPVKLNKKRFRQVDALHAVTEDARAVYLKVAGRSSEF